MLSLLVCAPALAQTPSEPERNFEHLWTAFDRDYAIFGPKRVDWRALYSVYRPRVTSQTTDDELFGIMSQMLGHLNDNHIMLTSDNPKRFFCAGYLGQHFADGGYDAYEKTMRHRPVPDSYFSEPLQEAADGIFGYGWITRDIGYLHLKAFEGVEQSGSAVDAIVQQFGGAKAVIVDVRRNRGGDDRVGKVIADRFADDKRLYMTTQTRNSATPGGFESKKYWYIEPGGPAQLTRPVILLTDRCSISAAENFALAMRVLPHVTTVGDFTSGCFADVRRDTLPNGWEYSVSYKLFLDHTGFCWEGIGVPPDIMQINSAEDLKAGRDRVAELAVALLQSGRLEPRRE